MIFDFCFYRYNLGHLSQYPTLEYAKEVIFESLELTLPLHGKRQFSLVKRGDSDKIRLYQIYNYIYNDNNDAFGICIVYHDKYPNDIEYMFKLCGATVVSILEEGKLLHLDSKGNIISDNRDLGNHYSTLNGHKVKFKDKILCKGTKLSPIPNNFYNNYEKQHVICQLSDKSWSLDELFENNNVVVITEEIEDENINNMRSFVKRSNETVKILNEQVKRLQEQLRQVEREKQKYEKQVKQATNNTTQHDVGDFFVWIIVGGFIAAVLLCLIAPWFISSMPIWIKFALLAAAGFGMFAVGYALEENHKGKYVAAFGWTGAIAILLSTVLTIYGLCGGFSFLEKSKRNTVVGITSKQDRALGNSKTPHFQLPKDFVLIPSGMLDNYYDYENKTILTYDVDSFFICKHEVLQKDFERIMGYNPSKFKGDSIPVHGMSVRDAVIYCNRRSVADGLRGFYEINGNVVMLKSDGNGYRLPTEEEWILASKKTKENAHEKPFPSQPHAQDVKRYDFKPHTVGEIQDKRRELFDLYGNVSELCVRSNGEIWGKGGSYGIALSSETSENGGLKAAENLSSTINLNADFGLRLVFIP